MAAVKQKWNIAIVGCFAYPVENYVLDNNSFSTARSGGHYSYEGIIFEYLLSNNLSKTVIFHTAGIRFQQENYTFYVVKPLEHYQKPNILHEQSI